MKYNKNKCNFDHLELINEVTMMSDQGLECLVGKVVTELEEIINDSKSVLDYENKLTELIVLLKQGLQ